MNHSFLHRRNHHINDVFMALLTAALLIFSSGAHSDPTAELDDIYLLGEAETNQRMLNSLWLEQGMKETPDYYENNEALQKFAQNAIKKYWAALVKNDQSYARYTPLVGGHFASAYNSTDLDINLSGNTIRFRLGYSF